MAQIRITVSGAVTGQEIIRASVPINGITQWLIELASRPDGDIWASIPRYSTLRFGVEGSPFTTSAAGISALIHGTRDMELRILVTVMAEMPLCEICGESTPEIPFANCRFCRITNAFHHGRCCRMNPCNLARSA